MNKKLLFIFALVAISGIIYFSRAVSEEVTEEASTALTGVIIDTSKTPFMPAMSPKIISEDGSEVYGTLHLDINYVIEVGVAGFADSLEGARQEVERVGKNPLVIRALSVSGPLKADCIISNRDAEEIRTATRVNNFFKRCAVVFVVS